PGIGPRLRPLDPASLRVRLALAMIVIAAAPLVLITSLDSAREERSVTAEIEPRQAGLTESLSLDIVQYLRLHRAAVAAIAEQPSLLGLSPEGQRSILQGFNRVYSDIVAFSTFGLDGRPIARSDDRPLTPLMRTAQGDLPPS